MPNEFGNERDRQNESKADPSEMEIAEMITAFIFKLSSADNMSDEEAVLAIVNNLQRLQKNRHFPDVIDLIDPGSNKSETKLLSEQAKQRLHDALNILFKSR